MKSLNELLKELGIRPSKLPGKLGKSSKKKKGAKK
jgi:hypothetical protein